MKLLSIRTYFVDANLALVHIVYPFPLPFWFLWVSLLLQILMLEIPLETMATVDQQYCPLQCPQQSHCSMMVCPLNL